jgi:hypothetical protein
VDETDRTSKMCGYQTFDSGTEATRQDNVNPEHSSGLSRRPASQVQRVRYRRYEIAGKTMATEIWPSIEPTETKSIRVVAQKGANRLASHVVRK